MVDERRRRSQGISVYRLPRLSQRIGDLGRVRRSGSALARAGQVQEHSAARSGILVEQRRTIQCTEDNGVMPRESRYAYMIRAIAEHCSDDCLIWPFHLCKRWGYGQVTVPGEGN